MLYLLQLVQALKFESAASDQRSSRSTTSAISYDDSGLSDFLITRGVKNHVLGNRLYWYLMVEVALEDRTVAKMYGRVVFKFLSKILEVRISSFWSLTGYFMPFVVGRWQRTSRAHAKARNHGRDISKARKRHQDFKRPSAKKDRKTALVHK